MKRTDLERNKAEKLMSAMQNISIPNRYSTAHSTLDKREQRKRDQALGLIPFAVKMSESLVKEIQVLAQTRDMPLNDLVTELLQKGLGNEAGDK